MPETGVAVVTYNAMPWLERCLESVRGVETVVVDNGSTDGTVDLVRTHFPDVKLIEQENLGLAAGWNAGMAALSERYALILNADAWLTPGSLERLVAFADGHPEAAIVGPRLLNPDGTLQRSVRGFPTLWRLATEYFFLRKLAPGTELLNGFYAGGFAHDRVREADFVMGACMLVRRTAVEQVGPLDESFFLFSEETDWAYRFAQNGWKTLFFPGAECVHVGGASHGGRLLRENVRGHLRFLAKHRGPAYAERARLLLRAALALPRPRVPRRARPAVPRRRRLARLRARPGAARAMTLIRLALATAVVLAPGAAVARALGLRGAAATLAWAFGALFAALGVTILVEGSLTLTLVLLLGIGVAALLIGYQAPRPERIPGRGWVFLAGVVLGIALWHVAGEIGGDGFFHLARVRKLEAFDSLSLGAVNEFADGGLHPGYAFPLWHAFLALVARVAFVDPSEVVLHEAVRARAPGARRRLRGRVGALPARRAGGGGRVRRGRHHGARAGRRRGVHGPRACPRPRRASCSCPRRSRSRSPLVFQEHKVGSARSRRSPRQPQRGSRSRSSTPRTRSSCGCRSSASSSCARSSRGTRRSGSRRRSAALVVPAAAYLAWLTPVVRATASHAPAATSWRARSPATRDSSTSSRTSVTGSRPRCSDGAAPSPSRRCSRSRSPGSRSAAAGPPTSSAARSPSSR